MAIADLIHYRGKLQFTHRGILFHLQFGEGVHHHILQAIAAQLQMHRDAFPVGPQATPGTLPVIRAIIAAIEDEAHAADLAASGLPVVDVGGFIKVRGVASVVFDAAAIGAMGARHLRDRGFHSYGFVSNPRRLYAKETLRGFSEEVAGGGRTCSVLQVEGIDVNADIDAMVRWLKPLQRPLGLMGSSGRRARHLVAACHLAGLRVPEDAAVLGTGNDELNNALAEVPLSSIRLDVEGLARRAVDLLIAQLQGEEIRPLVVQIPPLGVATRLSTDVVALDDPYVAAACAYIREHVAEGIQVPDVTKAVGLSRRPLEHRFRKALSCLPYEMIRRQRVLRAAELLVATDYGMDRIATRSGFPSAKRMAEAFSAVLSVSPSEYRRRNALKKMT